VLPFFQARLHKYASSLSATNNIMAVGGDHGKAIAECISDNCDEISRINVGALTLTLTLTLTQRFSNILSLLTHSLSLSLPGSIYSAIYSLSHSTLLPPLPKLNLYPSQHPSRPFLLHNSTLEIFLFGSPCACLASCNGSACSSPCCARPV
jgi:hypothetical protein